MSGKTEITINGLTYGIVFNNLAIGEAFSRFGLNPLSGEMKGIFAILKLIYSGMVAFSEMNDKPIPTYKEYLECYENDTLDQAQFETIFKVFMESKVISETLQKANELGNESKKKASLKKS